MCTAAVRTGTRYGGEPARGETLRSYGVAQGRGNLVAADWVGRVDHVVVQTAARGLSGLLSAAAVVIPNRYHMVLPMLALAVGGASEVLRRTVRRKRPRAVHR